MSLLDQEFERFAKANIPPDAGLGQRSDMQRAFYGGVLLMFAVTDELCKLDDAAALAVLDDIRADAFAFATTQALVGAIRQ
jgi:hypothetical protein